MTGPAPHGVSVRLYVVFSLLMAGSATASGLLLLYIAEPFITELGGSLASKATVLLFGGAAAAGALAAVGGLMVGLRFAGRIRGMVERAEALSPLVGDLRPPRATDELGALDAALGRLTLSMDRFVRDSDILARLPVGMLLLGPASGILSFNATAEAVLGMSLERYRGTPLLSSAGPFPLSRGNAQLARILDEAAASSQTVQVSELAATTAAGQRLLLEVTAQRREWGTETNAVLLLLRDASEKQRIREEIRRSDQLAFLGGMAARVAHEIRTPLATVRGLLELLETDIPEGDSRREYIERVLQALNRQDRLVENLLTLSHPEPQAARPVAVPELLSDLLGMFPRDPRLSLHVSDAAALPPVWGDSFRLGEVFTNLIQNALQSTPETGLVDVHVEALDSGRVRVAVRNTGVGIPPELHERIFQPFFTTKARGTGLGLAIARQIVEAHRGSIRVESDGTSETTFVVELPTAAPSAVPVAAEQGNG